MQTENITNGRFQAPDQGSLLSSSVSVRTLSQDRGLEHKSNLHKHRKKSTEHQLSSCSNEDCACGWETYVVDHNCKESVSAWTRIPIHNLLHQEQDNPLLRDYDPGTIRHVHLPANNMTWAQVSYNSGNLKYAKFRQLRILFCGTTTTKRATSNIDSYVETFGWGNSMGERARFTRDS